MGIAFQAILLIQLVLPVFTFSSQRLIYVSQTGINDSSCWEGGYSTPCLFLNQALKGAQHYNHSITILLQPGQHQLHNGSETQLRNVSQLAIVGNGSEGEIVIKCQPLAGLAFFECSEIEMNNIKIVGCGALCNSTSQYVRGYSSTILKIQAAVLFRSCKIVQLSKVQIIESNGTGVILYNPVDVVYIKRCQFLKNGLSDKQFGQAALYAGGGGLIVEANDAISQSFITITNSIFTSNIASSGQFSFLSPTINPSGYFGLGKGGGISVVFRGMAANNTVQIQNVQLVNNTAQFGGGLFLAFHDNTNANSVTIANTLVKENKAMTIITNTITSGGGVFVNFFGFPFNNTVAFTSCNFILNEARKGGGITVSAQQDTDYYCSTNDNILFINNCAFDSNTASGGSSAIISQSVKDSQPLLFTTVGDSNFTNGQCVGYFCSNSVLVDSLPITFKGTLKFSDNRLSALGLYSSSIKLLPSTKLQFINNSAVNGAALYIADCSSVIVNGNGTGLFFKNNTAGNNGGAIYVGTCAIDKTWNCFIRHSNSSLHPDDWNTGINFFGNQDHDSFDNSIYIDSVQSCLWPDSSKQQTPFCWNGWSYRDTSGVKDYCLNQLRSGPDYIVKKPAGLTTYTVYPGECINLLQAISVYDVWGHDITNQTNLQTDILSGATDIIVINTLHGYCRCSDFPLPNCRLPYQATNRPCETHDVQLLTNCSNKHYNYSSQILIHPPRLPDGIVLDIEFKLCDNKTTCGYNGKCIVDYNFQFVCYNTVCDKYNYSSFNYDCEPNKCLFSYNTICGSCTDPDYGIAVNFPHFSCAKCEFEAISIFICLELLPVLIMMVILTVFHINIVNGNLNAFILYSQMVTLQFPGLGYTGWVPNSQLVYFNYYFLGIPLTVYSIWNLNFLTLYRDPFCIPGIRTTTGVILLQYVIAACPLLFIIVSYTWIQCYNNGYRLVVYTTRPLHRLLAHLWRKLKIQPSLIDTYAGLLLLAYMRFSVVSAKLLQFVAIDAQSSSSLETMPVHATLGAIAVLCLIVFNLIPMAVVSLYHLKIFQRFLTWSRLDRPGLQALVDAYQGCFKNSATDGKERRYFAGIYLLFRFCYVAFFVTSLSPVIYYRVQGVPLNPLGTAEACLSVVMIGTILTLQPYKQKFHNVIDFLIIFYMGVIGGLSSSNFPLFVTIGPLFLPFAVLLAYIVYRLLKYCCCFCVKWITQHNCNVPDHNGEENYSQLENQQTISSLTTTTEVSIDQYVQDDLYADRILYPSEYKLFD